MVPPLSDLIVEQKLTQTKAHRTKAHRSRLKAHTIASLGQQFNMSCANYLPSIAFLSQPSLSQIQSILKLISDYLSYVYS